MELVRQVEVNIDYILLLVEKYRAAHCKDKTILASIASAVSSSLALRSKKELIEGFIANINVSEEVASHWQRYVQQRKEEELAALIEAEGLKPEEARKFLANSFASCELKTIGEDIQKIMPPSSPFDRASSERQKGIIERLKAFFEKYAGLNQTG